MDEDTYYMCGREEKCVQNFDATMKEKGRLEDVDVHRSIILG
jgi:hypothetical protein